MSCKSINQAVFTVAYKWHSHFKEYRLGDVSQLHQQGWICQGVGGASTPPGQMVDPPSESQKNTLGWGVETDPPGAPGRGFVSYCANCKQFNSLLFNVG